MDEYNSWYNKRGYIILWDFIPANPANEEEQEFLVTPTGADADC